MLAATLFSGFFILLANSAGNSISFAKQVLLAANPEVVRASDLDQRLLSFIAIVVLTFVCLVHYLLPELSLFLNRWLAAFKMGVLFACFIAGVIVRKKASSNQLPNGGDLDTVQPGYNPSDGIAALVYVLYSYQGWENANLVSNKWFNLEIFCADNLQVAGEIRLANDSPKRKLSLGAFLAVGTACLLYILTTLGYVCSPLLPLKLVLTGRKYLACDYETITGGSSELGMVVHFAPKVSFHLLDL